MIVVSFYKNFLSLLVKWLFGGGCRFFPSCSEYCESVLKSHGAIKGTYLTLKRLSRCHPWGGSGLDLPPSRRG